MSKLRFGLAAVCAAVFLSGCQTAQIAGNTSSFASTGVKNEPVKKRAVLPANEAASFIVKRPGGQNTQIATTPAAKKKKKTTSTKVAAVPVSKGPSFNGRRGRYGGLIAKHARAAGVPVRLAMAVVEVESGFRPGARGGAGEIGMMQILPRTARFIGYKGSLKNLYAPNTNLKYGMKYLAKAYRLGGKTTCGAILKYNAGHGAKKMNPISREYCRRVSRIMRRG